MRKKNVVEITVNDTKDDRKCKCMSYRDNAYLKMING